MQNYSKTIKNKELRRDLTLSLDSLKIDLDARTVELSFSSDEPYERWHGEYEVLSHDEGAIDFSRLHNKAALLANHDWNKQIGVVLDAYIEGNKGRALVKFSSRQEAQDYFKDVQDGIIANVSVGYMVKDAKYIDATDTVLVTRWQPYEISLVSVPADTTVGVGRNLEISNEPITNNQ